MREEGRERHRVERAHRLARTVPDRGRDARRVRGPLVAHVVPDLRHAVEELIRELRVPRDAQVVGVGDRGGGPGASCLGQPERALHVPRGSFVGQPGRHVRRHGPDSPCLEAGEDVRANLVEVGNHDGRDRDVVVRVPGGGGGEVARDGRIRVVRPGEVVEVEERPAPRPVHRGGRVPAVHEIREDDGVGAGDLLVERPEPGLQLELVRNLRPPEPRGSPPLHALGVVHPHRDEVRQPLHHERLSRRPREPAPDEVVEPAERALVVESMLLGRHPRGAPPLDRATEPVRLHDEEGAAGVGKLREHRRAGRRNERGGGDLLQRDGRARGVLARDVVLRGIQREHDPLAARRAGVAEPEDLLDERVPARSAGSEVVVEADEPGPGRDGTRQVLLLRRVEVRARRVEPRVADHDEGVAPDVRADARRREVEDGVRDAEVIEEGPDVTLCVRVLRAGRVHEQHRVGAVLLGERLVREAHEP